MFRVFWLSVKDTFDELFLLVGTNVIWLLLTAPLAAIALFFFLTGATALGALVALVAVLPGAPATAGLFTVAERVQEGRKASIGLFFEGFRQYYKLSWQVYGVWVFGLIVILINIQFYPQLGSLIGTFLQVLFVYLLLIWFALLMYIGPLMLLQSDKRLRTIARNALLMVFGRPIFSATTFIFMVLIIALSAALTLPVMLLTFSLLAVWGIRATVKLIKDDEDRRQALADAANDGPRANTDKGRGGQIRPRE